MIDRGSQTRACTKKIRSILKSSSAMRSKPSAQARLGGNGQAIAPTSQPLLKANSSDLAMPIHTSLFL
jgi:hypothetical protein